MISQVIIFAAILFVFILWLLNRRRIRYWVALLQERGWKSTVHYDRCLTVFKTLYTGVKPFQASLDERRQKNMMDDSSMIYGEVMFYSFVRILEKANPKPGEVFYDLGSGAGKAVMIAGLVFDFSKACGIEKLDSLYGLSVDLLKKLEEMPERKQLLAHKDLKIEFIHDDFLKPDISDADIVFLNATCFRSELFTAATKKLLGLKSGARIILTGANLDEIGGFELDYIDTHLMSWGLSQLRIYQRVR